MGWHFGSRSISMKTLIKADASKHLAPRRLSKVTMSRRKRTPAIFTQREPGRALAGLRVGVFGE
jgi:hypothetical protein